MLTMVNVGLILMLLGWLTQLKYTSRKHAILRRNFLYLYAGGSGLLALANLAESGFTAVLYLALCLSAVMALRKMQK